MWNNKCIINFGRMINCKLCTFWHILKELILQAKAFGNMKSSLWTAFSSTNNRACSNIIAHYYHGLGHILKLNKNKYVRFYILYKIFIYWKVKWEWLIYRWNIKIYIIYGIIDMWISKFSFEQFPKWNTTNNGTDLD